MAKDVAEARILMVLLRHASEDTGRFEERRAELERLCDAAGGVCVGDVVQSRNAPDSATYIGSGKVGECAEFVRKEDVDLVVFDSQLSPAQIRNLEGRLDCRVIDRTQLILDIFALRARTREGRLQVEIAQLRYMLPRLTGRGLEMSRLGGGIGTRGPGETKLEMDRRNIRRRITHLKSQLGSVRQHRKTQRAARRETTPVVALVGYTNAGKTTLMQEWTRRYGSGPTEGGANRLFDTLDPLARRVKCGTISSLVLMDTVGFVQDLPHPLVDAFRATLEEVTMADVIVHVVDASGDVLHHLDTVYEVLMQLDAVHQPIITFFNKMDAAKAEPAPDARAKQSVYGSAASGEGIDALVSSVEKVLGADPVQVIVDAEDVSGGFWTEMARIGRILESTDEAGDRVRVKLELDRRNLPMFQNRIGQYQHVQVEFSEELRP